MPTGEDARLPRIEHESQPSNLKRKPSSKSKLPDASATRSASPAPPVSAAPPGKRRSRLVSARKGSSKGPATAPDSRLQQRERWSRLFENLDTSGDSLIDKQEFLTAASLWADSCPRILSDEFDFSCWDSDGDGTLCEGEFMTFCDALFQILGEREFGSLEAQLQRQKDAALPPIPGAAEPASGNAEHRRASQKKPAKATTTSGAAGADDAERRGSARKIAVASGAVDEAKSWAPLAQQAAEKLRDVMDEEGGKDKRKALRKAINEARLAGVDRELVDEAVHLVRQIEVLAVLQKAMASENPTLLRAAILNVRAMEADSEALDEAEKLLSVWDIREGLKNAIASKNAEALQAAIVKAEGQGMQRSDLADARLNLEIMRQVPQREALDEALQRKDATKLNQLITMYRQAIENNDKLNDLVDPMLKEAIAALPEIEQYAEARASLNKVLLTGAVLDIKIAIEDGTDAGLDEAELGRARRILKKEETRQALLAAIKSEKRRSLTSAIEAASEFDVEMPELELARRLVKRLDISRDISLAMDHKDLKALRSIIADAKMQGLDDAKVHKAEQLLAQLSGAGRI